MTPPCEQEVLDACALEECLVPWFLMCGYAYEVLDRPLVSDATWDLLCRTLDRMWDSYEHRHKHLVERESLSTGTASYLTADRVPGIARSAAERKLA